MHTVISIVDNKILQYRLLYRRYRVLQLKYYMILHDLILYLIFFLDDLRYLATCDKNSKHFRPGLDDKPFKGAD